MGRDPSSEDRIVLGLLSLVERDREVTQRGLAQELGIALGLANAYLRRCIRKGLIKVKQAPARRYVYYLTPSGFSEKSRMTSEYLRHSFGFFRLARQQSAEILRHCVSRGWSRLAVFGASELGEIVVLSAREYQVTVAGLVDPSHHGRTLLGMTVAAGIDGLDDIHAVVLADLTHPQREYDRLVARMPLDRVLVPPLLRVTQTSPGEP